MNTYLFSSSFLKNSFKTQKFLNFLSFVSIFIFSVFFIVSHSALASQYSVSALDSIAGYGSEITVKNVEKNAEISVILHTPENRTETLHKTSDSAGTVHFIIPKKDTYEAGIYEFVAIPKGFSFEDGNTHSFEIFADDPSASLSKISTENISLATGKTGKISVLLQDQYGNKIANHRVQLISSRNTDSISILSEISGKRTDANGQIDFSISSWEEGNSRISALDQTSGISLNDRKNILFYDNSSSQKTGSRFSASMFGAGGDDEDTASDEAGLVSEFVIDFPSTIGVHSSDNFLTITAVDTQGKTLQNFTGTIFIRIPDDENATVPGENGKYTFLTRDEGTFTFSQSLTFSQTGSQTIEVFLYDLQKEEINVNVFGKKSVQVEENGEYQGPISNNDITILTPENNSKFSSSSVSITGTSAKNSDVKIFLDNSPYKSLSTDDKGIFSLIIHDLDEGNHSVYAQQIEGKKKSNTIQFSIDSSSPEITSSVFSETNTTPNAEISLTLKTKGDAKEVLIRIDNEEKKLAKISGSSASSSTWKTEFSVPSTIGQYPVLAIVTDEYGNTSKQVLTQKITVKKAEISGDILTGEFSEEKKSIILEWKNILPDTPILYILSTGTSKNSLKKSKSISGSSTQIEYSEFTAGDKIFIAITPVDATGKEGKISNVLEIQTKIIKEVVEPEKDPEFSVKSEEGQLYVRWESSKNSHHYELLYGIESGEYLSKVQKNAFQNADTLSDLISEKKYFVRILAKDSLGNTIFDYGEKSVTIGEITFHPAPTKQPQNYPEWITKTGPQLFLFIGAIFFIASGIILGRRQKG